MLFLSATFAKRPDNMPLYAVKTCMSETAMTSDGPVEAISRDGVALQEVLSASLVAEGQMIRRERSFEGVEVNYISLNKDGNRDFGVEDLEKKHIAIADKITNILRGIIAFEEKYIKDAIAELDSEVKAEMKEVEKRKGTAQPGVSSTPYFSKLFMVINQMFFLIKAEAVAQRAVQRLQEGKKPVIAFASIPGAFLESMENQLLSAIRNISISPIDNIKFHIEQAGYSVTEVTGRGTELLFQKHGSMAAPMKNRKKEGTDYNCLFTTVIKVC